MWDQIINIHSCELLSIKTKEFRINELLKKKKKKCFTIVVGTLKLVLELHSLEFCYNDPHNQDSSK